MAHFPIPAPAFDGRSRAVDASAVFDWLKQGWGIFMANPLLWVAAAAIVIAGLEATATPPDVDGGTGEVVDAELVPEDGQVAAFDDAAWLAGAK